MATPSLQSLQRGLIVLEFVNRTPGCSLDAVASALNLTRGTAYRLLETLRREGYVAQARRGRFVVADRVLCLSDGRLIGRLPAQSQGVLDQLSHTVQWPAAIAMPGGADMITLMVAGAGARPNVRSGVVGLRRPMAHCAGGLAYLAACEKAQRERMIAGARLDGKNLGSVLNAIRRRGFAADTVRGVTTMAVPLMIGAAAAGAVQVRFPTRDVDDPAGMMRLLPELANAAASLRNGFHL